MRDLDYFLSKAVKLQREEWQKPDTGVGAACLFIPATGEEFYDVCRDVGHNNFAHAEHNVIEAYVEKYKAPPPKDAVIITTISPCSNANSSWRIGDSCSSLIKEYGLKHVYAGVNVDDKSIRHEFNLRVTQNKELATICKNLYELFDVKTPRNADGTIGRLVSAYKNDLIFDRVFKI